MPTHRHASVVLLSLLVALGGCPDLPESTTGDGDTIDGEAFVPLTVDRIYESVGEPPGGERIAIYGAGFTNGAEIGLPEITFGGQRGENPLVLDDNQINVTVPGRDPGLVDVVVRLPDGQEQTLRDAYLYRGPLAITSISPTVATIDGNIEVEVKGQGFTKDTRILIAGRMLQDADRVDDQTIVGKVPAILAIDAAFDAQVDVIASNGFEQRTLPDAFTFATPLTLTGLTPVSGTSLGGTLVTLRGTGLALTTNVYVGGVPAENVSVDSQGSALVVRMPPGPHGAADIRVENVSGDTDSTAPLEDAFFHVDESRLPGVLWAGHTVPKSGSPTGGYPVAISVRGLTAATGLSVRWGSVQAPIVETRIEEGTIIVTAPRGEGDVPVVVSRSGVEANALVFTYVKTFTIEDISPKFVSTRGGEVVFLGVGLDGATVHVGGKRAPTQAGAGDRLIATVEPGSPGSVDIVVRKDGRELRLSAGLEYRSDETRLWAISPELGAQSGGRIVRMFGEGFTRSEPDALFGGERGTDATLVDDHVLIARAPLGEPGNVNVGGDPAGRLAMAYRYYDPAQRFGGTMGGPIPEALNITVLDRVTRKGVPDAFVILWDDISGPYQGLTDARGQITFSDVYFGPMQMVTAGADDYTTASIVEFDARDATLNLIPLSPSNPGGGGGGGPGPEPLPDSNLSGKVIGFDKYVVTPPGSCDSRLDLVTGPLCSPCASNAECGGGDNLCTPLGKEGARCTTHCEVHSDCQAGFSCAAVEGGTQCVPSSGRRTARCQVTMPDVFSVIEVPLTPTDTNSEYAFDTDPGEYSVVCLGGVEDEITGAFTPLVMGVRRHVFAQAGMEIGDQDVVLDIPLSRTLRIRLDGAPTGSFKTKRHTAQVFVNLGADGVFLMPEEGSGLDQNVFELEGFPAAFAESLYDASLTVYATAVADVPPADQEGVGSFVVHDGINQLFSDAVFELGTELGVSHRATGISEPVWGMRELAGTDRLWAVGEGGRVAAFDGSLWGVQQTPTDVRLTGVWPAAVEDVWAVGDAGAVLRFDGLRWVAVPMPAAIARAAWRGIEGVVDEGGTTLWIWGERGVYRNTTPDSGDVNDWVEVTGPAVGSVNAIRVVSAQEAWLVGHGGLIQRWQNGAVTGLTDFTMPGADLNALTVVRDDLVWAVGDEGRIVRWDGAVWFDLLPVTSRSLRGIAAPRDDRAWAVGDAGEVVRWDGVRWRVEVQVPHSDLFAVGETPSGRVFAAGVATLIIGPFMQLPRPTNPTSLGELRSLNLRWSLEPGADASFNWLLLFHPSGFPFWQIVAADPRRNVPLPDLKAAWGLEAMWPGNNFLQMYRVYIPGFDMGAWDETILTEYRWHSWSVDVFDMIVPEAD